MFLTTFAKCVHLLRAVPQTELISGRDRSHSRGWRCKKHPVAIGSNHFYIIVGSLVACAIGFLRIACWDGVTGAFVFELHVPILRKVATGRGVDFSGHRSVAGRLHRQRRIT